PLLVPNAAIRNQRSSNPQERRERWKPDGTCPEGTHPEQQRNQHELSHAATQPGTPELVLDRLTQRGAVQYPFQKRHTAGSVVPQDVDCFRPAPPALKLVASGSSSSEATAIHESVEPDDQPQRAGKNQNQHQHL